jgi:ribosomal RNA-processing protein 36
MEPASSSDDDSSVDEQTSSLPSSFRKEGDLDDVNEHEFNDLPSEDSCMDSDSDSDSDSGSDSDSDSEKPDEFEDMTLEERILAKRNQGVRRNRFTATKKSKALEIAQKRLSEMKQKKLKGDKSDSRKEDEDKKKSKKKKSKHAPTIASSKRQAYYSRGAPDLNSSGIGVEIGANRYKPRDPRHQSLSGHFDQNVFEKRYEFLEKMQDDEIDKMKQRCKAWKMSGKKGQRLRKKMGMVVTETAADDDQAELNRLIQERTSRTDVRLKTTARRNVKKRLRDEVASGQRGAYYLKKRDMKKMELEAKFEELKRIGGDKKVNEVMAKRRKKKMGRDSSLMPTAP